MSGIARLWSIRFVCVFVVLCAVVPFTAAADTTGSVTCRIEVGEYRVTEADGSVELNLEGFGVVGTAGGPRLPGKIFAIAVPPGAMVTGVSVDGKATLLPGTFRIEPVGLPRMIGEEKADVYQRQLAEWTATRDGIYSNDQGWPARPVEFVRRAGLRKYNLADVRVAPFRYHPLSGTLYHYPKLEVTVEYTLATGAGRMAVADHIPQMELTAKSVILNYDQAQAWYPETTAPGSTKDFVLITTEALSSSVTALMNHEAAKGRTPEVVTVEWIYANYSGYDNAEKVRAFLRDKYPSSQWGIRDVLLVGHHDQVPMRLAWQDLGYGKPRTDFYYAELSEADADSWDSDGDHLYGEDSDDVDLYNEVNVGRIPWSLPAHVSSICEKSVAFELNSDPAFKKNILLLGSFLWECTDTAELMEAKFDQPWMAEWSSIRMYEQNSTVFSTFPCDYELTHANVMDVWANGTFCFVNYAGHGTPWSSHIMGHGTEAFIEANDCSQLNDNYPAIVWAVACSNSDPHEANIGREMMRNGAVGFVGATNVAPGCGEWNDPYDGRCQSCDYWFTTKVTSGEMTQGEAHQYSLRQNYVNGLWYDDEYEIFEWTLWGNPDLGLGDSSAPAGNLVTGAGPAADNTTEVRVWNSANVAAGPTATFTAYGVDKFGTNVAVGDIDGDGVAEIVTGPGPGAVFGPNVRGFELNSTPVPGVSFLAYGTLKWGVNVACGDIDGDGIDEIVTGPGPGAEFGPHVRGWNYDGGTVTPMTGVSFFAYGTHKWGVNVSCGDIDYDGADEIITGAAPGPSYGAHIRSWDMDGTTSPASGVSFFAFGTQRRGVNVSCGDIDGDGRAEIIAGAGPGALMGPHIRAFGVEGTDTTAIPGVSFFAYGELGYGVRVGCGDLDGDGICEIISGEGPDPSAGSCIRGWNFDGGTLTQMPGIDFDAFDAGVTHGANVAVVAPEKSIRQSSIPQ